MKSIKHILGLLIGACLLFAGCDSMDSVYKEFIGDGTTTYMAKLEGIETFAGENQVKFFIPAQTDPRIKGIQFYWDNKTKEKDVAIDPLVDNEIIIDGVTDGSHIFELISHDDKDHVSVPLTLSANAYGDVFRSSTPNSSVISACRNSEGLCLFKLHHSSSIYYQYMELIYKDLTGKEKVIKIERGTNQLYVDDISGDSYSFRSIYLPEETAFQTITSDLTTVNAIDTPHITVADNTSIAFAKGSNSLLECECPWAFSVEVDASAAEWLSATMTENYVSVQAKTRNADASPRTGTVTITSDNITKTITVTQGVLSPKIGTAYGEEGIIFWQNPDNPTEYKIISAAGNLMVWSSKATVTGAKSLTGKTSVNGVEYDNNDMVKAMEDYGNGTTYAVEWVANLGEGWYMPSIDELKDEFWPVFNGCTFEVSTKDTYAKATQDERDCRDKFEAAMAAIGGQKINMGTTTGAGTCIMACCEVNASNAYGFRVSNSAIISQAKTTAAHYARGVKVVTITD